MADSNILTFVFIAESQLVSHPSPIHQNTQGVAPRKSDNQRHPKNEQHAKPKPRRRQAEIFRRFEGRKLSPCSLCMLARELEARCFAKKGVSSSNSHTETKILPDRETGAGRASNRPDRRAPALPPALSTDNQSLPCSHQPPPTSGLDRS